MQLINNVVVTNLLDKTIRITWDASQSVTQYKVYRSAVPYANFTEIATLTTVTSYIDQPTIIPINEWYYKVAEYDGSSAGPIPSYGITSVDYSTFDKNPFTQPGFLDCYGNIADMKLYFDQIRSRNLWMLENDGENMILLKRRYEGTKCPLVDQDEAEQCAYPLGNPRGTNVCFGTNYLGGYYDSLPLKIRRIATGQVVNLAMTGFRLDMTPQFWTIWSPRIGMGDVIVDQRNQRFEVTNVTDHVWRGLSTHQDFQATLKPARDMIYQIPT